MKVVVCVKQIPDPADPGEIDPATNIKRNAIHDRINAERAHG